MAVKPAFQNIPAIMKQAMPDLPVLITYIRSNGEQFTLREFFMSVTRKQAYGTMSSDAGNGLFNQVDNYVLIEAKKIRFQPEVDDRIQAKGKNWRVYQVVSDPADAAHKCFVVEEGLVPLADIRIEKPIVGATDSFGVPTYAWQAVYTGSANSIATSNAGGELSVGEHRETRLERTFVVPFLATIDTTCRIIVDNQTFAVSAVADRTGRKQFLEVVAVLGEPT